MAIQDDGYYWVRMRDADEITIGQWLVQRWFLVGHQRPFLADEVTVIGERLAHPDD